MAGSLGDLVVSLSANTAQFTGAMDKAAFQSQKRMDEMVKSANRLGQMIGAGMVAGAGAFAIAMKRAIDSADDIGKTSQKVGMTTEALSGLRYAADLSGVSAEELTSSLGRMNKSAAEGNPAFEAMGINVKKANGELKSSDEIFKEIAGKFSGYKDGVEKSALAMEIFGKSGAQIIPMLNSGADGLEEMADEAKSFGLVVSKETKTAAEAFNDNLTRIGKTQEGLVMQMTAALLPTMKTASEEFVTLAKNTDLVTVPATAAKVLFQTLAVVGSDVAHVFRMTGNEIGGIAAQLAALATLDFKGAGLIGDMMKEDARKAREELDAFQARIMGAGSAAESEAKKAESGGGIAAPIVAAAKAAAKAKNEMADLLTPAAKEYAGAIEKMNSAQEAATLSTLDLNGAQSALYSMMQTAEWEKMPESWKQTAIAQAASATAMIEVADRQKQINDMMAATPTEQIEKSREAMMLLKEEFDAGRISAEQFIEAAGTKLGTLPPYAEKAADSIDTVITNAFDNMANSVADFALTGKASFGDMVSSMVRDLIKLEIQTNMTTAFKSAGGLSGIMGSIGSAVMGYFGGGGSEAAISSGSSTIFGPPVQNAKGGVFANSPSLSSYSGGVYNKPTPFMFASGAGIFGEAGPEAIMPLKRGADGKLGVSAQVGMAQMSGGSVTVNVINNGDSKARTEKRSDGKGGSIIDVFIEQVKGSLASDISSGNGSVPAALQGSYGLKRQAGAY